MFGFERLQIWQRSIDFADRLYDVTDAFPNSELFGLTSQLRRAGVSVAGNIAEGWGRGSTREFIRHVEIAYASLMEIVSHLTIAKRRRYVSDHVFDAAYAEAEEISRMLSGFRTSLEKKLE